MLVRILCPKCDGTIDVRVGEGRDQGRAFNPLGNWNSGAPRTELCNRDYGSSCIVWVEYDD